MSIKQSQLLAPVQLTNVVATYITVPANSVYRIGRAGFSNVTGGAVTITVYLVPAAGTAGVTNELITTLAVPANSTYISPELAGLVMPQGSTLQALASAGASIVAYASGVWIQ